MSNTKTCLLMFTLLFSSQHAWAELQFWVSVHSFQKEQNAQRAVAGTAAQLAERFRVLGVSTDKGFFYRVASGPYLTREIAEEQVRTARASGFEGAWLWADEGAVFDRALQSVGEGAVVVSDPTVLAEVDYADIDYASTSYDLTDFDSDTGYDSAAYGSNYEDDPDLLMQRQPPPELVEEAPAGYKLNKLHRNE